MRWRKGVLGAVMALVPMTAAAQDAATATQPHGPEVAIGLFAHGVRLFRPPPPAGYALYEGEEERGTVDVQLVYRSRPLTKALKPRLTARLQLNTGGRTSFASAGAEWRQHVLQGRLYGQVGIGLTIHDGYRYTPDPFAPGLSPQEMVDRYDVYAHRTGFGSRVLFNPNISVGVRLGDRWAAEVAFEHFSHKRVFSDQNPGIHTLGLRLVRLFGKEG